MRKAGLAGLVLVMTTAACAKGGTLEATRAPAALAGPVETRDGVTTDAAPLAVATTFAAAEPADVAKAATWIGAAAEGEMLSAETRETFLGLWVDVPGARPEVRPPMELALLVDTSGSMAGAKIENARAAARTVVQNLKDGDIVTLDAFSDDARTIVPPTRLDASSRERIIGAIGALTPSGSTNMFEGLSLAEGQLAAAPATHTLRRVVVISDGIANVGPKAPDVLGALAERGLSFRTQVTSLGVGTDYDERTLDALAVRSSGRLYHLSEPKEMASILRTELSLLDATIASNAFVEVVPAAGVQLEGALGVRADHQEGGALRIPLGALYAGQHREALVRVRIVDSSTFEARTRPLASVRLRFRDARDGDLERIQEVVARVQLTTDEAAVARSVSSRTKAIVALQESARIQLAAAQRVNDGNFDDADRELERAERALAAQAQAVSRAPNHEAEKKRLEEARGAVASARAATRAMPAAPKSVQRDHALKMNADAMHSNGF